jgi:hypothetical protein
VTFDPKENLHADLLATHMVESAHAFSNLTDALIGETVSKRILLLAAARVIASTLDSAETAEIIGVGKHYAGRLVSQQVEAFIHNDSDSPEDADWENALLLDDCGLTAELLGDIASCESCGMRHAPPHDEPLGKDQPS